MIAAATLSTTLTSNSIPYHYGNIMPPTPPSCSTIAIWLAHGQGWPRPAGQGCTPTYHCPVTYRYFDVYHCPYIILTCIIVQLYNLSGPGWAKISISPVELDPGSTQHRNRTHVQRGHPLPNRSTL
jgi:hypothetical protein